MIILAVLFRFFMAFFLLCFSIYTVIFTILTIKKRSKQKKRLIINSLMVIFVLTLSYYLFLAETPMKPKIRTDNIAQACEVIIAQSDNEEWQKEVQTSHYYATIYVGKMEDAYSFFQTTRVDDIRYVEGTDAEVSYRVTYTFRPRTEEYFNIAETCSSDISCLKDEYFIFISFYYRQNLIEELFSGITAPEAFYREKIDLMDIATAKGEMSDEVTMF
ncbi:MAG: hypothetical protein ACOX45_04470 [Acutalibacteraceae bacterium]